MKDFILQNLTSADTITLATVVMNNIVAMIGAFFLMFAYKITYAGNAYSRRYNVSIGTMVLISTMIMSVIGNNVALSLGMVGALSIIRFRTAVKDVRDAMFIFWALAIGIGCGVSQYSLIAVGSIFILLFLLLTKQAVLDSKQLLIIQAELHAQNEVEAIVDAHFEQGVSQTMKSVTKEKCELVYSVKENVLTKANEKNMVDIAQRLMQNPGVRSVNIIEQLDDIGR